MRRDGASLMIRTTVFDARERRAYERQLLAARQVADLERDRLRLLVAGLQRSLLPTSLAVPPGMTTASHYHMASADEVGGDSMTSSRCRAIGGASSSATSEERGWRPPR
jgi:sigma-B regulation protein RsbU (phosphoserine phosphatase)